MEVDMPDALIDRVRADRCARGVQQSLADFATRTCSAAAASAACSRRFGVAAAAPARSSSPPRRAGEGVMRCAVDAMALDRAGSSTRADGVSRLHRQRL
jgi:hypothetical protein